MINWNKLKIIYFCCCLFLLEGHFLLYNAPYSPELNPIEHIFHFWKSRVEKVEDANSQQLMKKLGEAWYCIDKREIRATVAYVRSTIFLKALNKKNLSLKDSGLNKFHLQSILVAFFDISLFFFDMSSFCLMYFLF